MPARSRSKGPNSPARGTHSTSKRGWYAFHTRGQVVRDRQREGPDRQRQRRRECLNAVRAIVFGSERIYILHDTYLGKYSAAYLSAVRSLCLPKAVASHSGQDLEMAASAPRRLGKLLPSGTAFFACDVQERFRDLIFNMPAVISTARLASRLALYRYMTWSLSVDQCWDHVHKQPCARERSTQVT